MASRGRGGKTTLTHDQLQAMGIGKDMPQVLTPPPDYPTLHAKVVNKEITESQDSQLLWREDYLHEMNESPYYITTDETPQNTITQRYSEKCALADVKVKPAPIFNWKLMPRELRTRSRTRTKRKKRPHIKVEKVEEIPLKTPKIEPIDERLVLLEELERIAGPNDVKKEKSDSENEVEDVPLDEEMDDDNDYGGNYFDNGEGFNEEDDNLDDGPIY